MKVYTLIYPYKYVDLSDAELKAILDEIHALELDLVVSVHQFTTDTDYHTQLARIHDNFPGRLVPMYFTTYASGTWNDPDVTAAQSSIDYIVANYTRLDGIAHYCEEIKNSDMQSFKQIAEYIESKGLPVFYFPYTPKGVIYGLYASNVMAIQTGSARRLWLRNIEIAKRLRETVAVDATYTGSVRHVGLLVQLLDTTNTEFPSLDSYANEILKLIESLDKMDVYIIYHEALLRQYPAKYQIIKSLKEVI